MITKLNSNRRNQSGHILLPLFGIFYWLPCWMTVFILAAAGTKSLAHSGHPGFAAISALSSLLFYFIFVPFIAIALAILVEFLEMTAMRIGVGVQQYWSGKNLLEKLSRELFRAGTFFGGAAIAYLIVQACGSHLILAGHPDDGVFKAMVFCACWQISVVGLTLLLAVPKQLAPGFGGFRGDENWVYPHVF